MYNNEHVAIKLVRVLYTDVVIVSMTARLVHWAYNYLVSANMFVGRIHVDTLTYHATLC